MEIDSRHETTGASGYIDKTTWQKVQKKITSWDDEIEAIEDKVVWTSRVCKVDLFQLNVAI